MPGTAGRWVTGGDPVHRRRRGILAGPAPVERRRPAAVRRALFRCPAGRCGRALVVGADHRGWRQDMDGAAVASASRSQAGRPQPDGAVCRQPRHPVRHGRAWAGAALRRPGKNWRYLDTGYEGTLWSGAVLADGRLLLGGQRGTLLQGSADGKAFRRVPTQGKGSVTSIAVAGARVLAVGLDGLKVRSRDGGNSFQEAPSADGLSLTAALFNADGTPLLFSRRGVMPRQE